MSKYLSLLVSFLLTVSGLSAQAPGVEKKRYNYNHNFDLAFSTNGNQSSGALSWVKFHSISKKKRFKIGYGIRFTSQAGKNLNYVTAPAILTSKETGPQVLFSKIYYENVDTFFVSRAQNNLLNVSINLQYTIKGKLDIGFNIDAAGFSFGGSTTGKYIAYQSDESETFHTASPTRYNLLLVSDNDIGGLNSEVYFRYWFHEKWAIRAGASFLFTEYTTKNKLRLNNDRWRNKSLMGLVGITFSPFR
ncbi:hypothetical protein CNR22_01890 [Sphingobacteriaceae bacterium]|nr:hypothetical protein CNR22_01890 [Sphingobacteriaceae bacterium]